MTDYERRVEQVFTLNFHQWGQIRAHSETQQYISISLKKSPSPAYYAQLSEENSIGVLRWVVIYVKMMLIIVKNDHLASHEEKAKAQEIADEITSYLNLKIEALTSDMSMYLLQYIERMRTKELTESEALYIDELIIMSKEWGKRITEYKVVEDLYVVFEEMVYFERIAFVDAFRKNLSDFA